MKVSKLFLMLLFLVQSLQGHIFSAEKIVSDQQLVALEDPVTRMSENTQVVFEVVDKEELTVSPLVALEQNHGSLHLSAFDAEYLLYPVKVISIDGWQVPDDSVTQIIRLAVGEHQLRIVPDFSKIGAEFVFMSAQWDEKHISFMMHDQQNIALTARLLNTEKLLWEVQMYRIKLDSEE